MILIFLVLHVIGARYNYGFVSFGNTIGNFFGTMTNSYDRFVHFFFGALLVYPIRELFLKVAKTKAYWSYYFSFTILLSFSVIYEIMEWFSVLNLDAHTGSLFIGGTDPFDAPKDMLMSTIGAIIAILIIILVSKYRRKKIKQQLP